MAKRRPFSTSSKTLPPAGEDLDVPQGSLVTRPLAEFTPKGLRPEPSPFFTCYRVNRAISQLSHGSNVYPVKNGLVDLPDGETWYTDLIKNGVLAPV